MQKTLIAAALAVAFATPVFAAGLTPTNGVQGSSSAPATQQDSSGDLASGAGSVSIGSAATVGQVVDAQTQDGESISATVAPGPVAQNPGDPLYLPSVAIGPGAGAGNGASVAVGPGARALLGYTTAIGNLSNATRGGATAIGAGSVATGVAATALGTSANASGIGALAAGVGSSAPGAYSSAFGAGAQANGTNSAAIGADSVANRADSVSVGNAATGQTRQITNVAPATQATDAPNLGQVQGLISQATGGILDQANRHADGVASMAAASSMAPMFGPKGYAMTAATAAIGGQAALGLGFAHAFQYRGHPAYWQAALGVGSGGAGAMVKVGASIGW